MRPEDSSRRNIQGKGKASAKALRQVWGRRGTSEAQKSSQHGIKLRTKLMCRVECHTLTHWLASNSSPSPPHPHILPGYSSRK